MRGMLHASGRRTPVERLGAVLVTWRFGKIDDDLTKAVPPATAVKMPIGVRPCGAAAIAPAARIIR